MGIETTCRVETDAGAGEARVLLETEELVVRGALKTLIPFKSLEAAVVDGRKLIVTKVAKFSESHTAEKLVVPVAKRG